MTYDKARVFSVSCPQCGVAEDERCRSASGKFASDPHTARKGVVYPRFLKDAHGHAKRGVPK